MTDSLLPSMKQLNYPDFFSSYQIRILLCILNFTRRYIILLAFVHFVVYSPIRGSGKWPGFSDRELRFQISLAQCGRVQGASSDLHLCTLSSVILEKTNTPSFSFLVQLDPFLKESVRRLNALFLFFTYLLSYFFCMLMATDAFDSVSIFVFQRLFFLYPANIEHSVELKTQTVYIRFKNH